MNYPEGMTRQDFISAGITEAPCPSCGGNADIEVYYSETTDEFYDTLAECKAALLEFDGDNDIKLVTQCGDCGEWLNDEDV